MPDGGAAVSLPALRSVSTIDVASVVRMLPMLPIDRWCLAPVDTSGWFCFVACAASLLNVAAAALIVFVDVAIASLLHEGNCDTVPLVLG